ncbi:SMP-30/gluconolactonase/LRE family protein [Leptospira perdikensis]
MIVFYLVLVSCRTPEEYFKKQIKGPVELSYHPAFDSIKSEGDPIKQNVTISGSVLPAQDEILLQEDLGRAFVASIDGWIWKVDLKNNTTEPFLKTPLLPGGMVFHPKNPDIIFMCLSRGKQHDINLVDGPGIYELTISTKQLRKIGTRVPLVDKTKEPLDNQIGIFFSKGKETKIPISKLNETNSRNVEKADDLAISNDGERIYFTEPYDHPNSILGVSSQSKHEVLTLGRNGHLWKYDLKDNTASLIAYQYTYLDGILLEYSQGETETSILLNELSKSRLVRLHLTGDKEGKDEIVIEGLPGFPDGMDRDATGRIWIAVPVERSKLITWLHKHPFWKSLVLYIPESLQPVSKKTGIIALSPNGSKPIYYSVHDGSLFSYIIVVVPGKEKLYLAVYQDGFKGLVTLPYPNNI